MSRLIVRLAFNGSATLKEGEAQQHRIFFRISVVAPTTAGFSEPQSTVELEGSAIGCADFQGNFGDVSLLQFGRKRREKIAGNAAPLSFGGDADGLEFSLGSEHAGHGKTEHDAFAGIFGDQSFAAKLRGWVERVEPRRRRPVGVDPAATGEATATRPGA